MTAATPAPVVIIGIGNPMRRDDGVGPAVVARLERDDCGDIELITLDGEPARVMEAWRDRRKAVVVDAARTAGAAPGEIHRLAVGADPLPAWTAGSSSHSTGLAEAVALGRVLDVLPAELVVFGVEAGDLSLGEGLTDDVGAALSELVDRVAAEARR